MRLKKLGMSNKNFLNFSYSKLISHMENIFCLFYGESCPIGSILPGLCWHHRNQLMSKLSLPWFADNSKSAMRIDLTFLILAKMYWFLLKEGDCEANRHIRARSSQLITNSMRQKIKRRRFKGKPAMLNLYMHGL